MTDFFFWQNEKPLRMVWRVEKNSGAAYLIGTAHFFPHSFARPLTRLLRAAPTVLFEGPLDDVSSARIAEYGRQGAGVPTFVDALTPEAIREIERVLRRRLADANGDEWLLTLVERKPIYFESCTRDVRPWAAFFSIWRACLAWNYSMDLEGYQIARRLGKPIQFLETLDEQLAVLDNIPLERIAHQLNDYTNWETYKHEYVRTFLAGDLDRLMTLTARFVTRGPVLVGARDQILFDRMQPILARESAVAFVGFPHVPGVTALFRNAGYAVTQVRA